MREPHDDETPSREELVGVNEISQGSEGDDKFSVVLIGGKVVKTAKSRKAAEATVRSFPGATVQEIKQTVEQPSFDMTTAVRE